MTALPFAWLPYKWRQRSVGVNSSAATSPVLAGLVEPCSASTADASANDGGTVPWGMS
jgi:hypothetical protein